jgi:hypothetical protein
VISDIVSYNSVRSGLCFKMDMFLHVFACEYCCTKNETLINKKVSFLSVCIQRRVLGHVMRRLVECAHAN